jgi:NAD(P)H-hydrate repair Nnr-like enzyme with NAD(P)H-hydrate dehydratase domain
MKIYKRIIEQLTDATHQQSAVLTENAMKLAVLQLTKINDKLNDKVECLMEEISSLKCTVLLKDQIMEEQ